MSLNARPLVAVRTGAAVLLSCLALAAHAATPTQAQETVLDGVAAAMAAQRAEQPARGPIKLVAPALPMTTIFVSSPRPAEVVVTHAGGPLPPLARNPPPGITVAIQSIAAPGTELRAGEGEMPSTPPGPHDLVIEASSGLPDLALQPPPGKVVYLKFNPDAPPVARDATADTAPGVVRLLAGAAAADNAAQLSGPGRNDIVVNYAGGELPALAQNPPAGKQVWLRAMPAATAAPKGR